MNYQSFMREPADLRAAVFIDGAADRRTSPGNIEKDFWICFVLDAIFAKRKKSWPQMLFRGGTSLSKAFGLIDRFSEDIDVAIDRSKFLSDSLSSLETMDNRSRQHRLEELNDSATVFIAEDVIPHLIAHFRDAIPDAADRPDVVVSKGDALTIEIPYKSIIQGDGDAYVRSTVRLEFSIRAALTPSTTRNVVPYITKVLTSADLTIAKVPTITAHRTFWDKFLIAHEIKDRFAKRENLIRADERVSRHYYDLYKLIAAKTVGISEKQLRLARSCQRHSQLFYPTPGVDITAALPGTFDIVPDEELTRWLARDYAQMSVMIFDDAPTFATILSELERFQSRVNGFESRHRGERSAS